MSCKITIEHNSKEAGKRSTYLMTSDAASLEARVCAADTACNDSGIDPSLYEIYKVGSEIGEDMHSMTGFNTFCKSINMQVNELTCQDGKVFILVDTEEAYGEGRKLVKGDGFSVGDSFLSYKDVTDEDLNKSIPHKIISIDRRPMTIHDFLKRKKTAPFADWRQTAKLLNFLLLFGGGASVLRKQLQGSKFTVEDCKHVIDVKYADWYGTDYEKYLRPETLFGSKFQNYLNQKLTPQQSVICKRHNPEDSSGVIF